MFIIQREIDQSAVSVVLLYFYTGCRVSALVPEGSTSLVQWDLSVWIIAVNIISVSLQKHTQRTIDLQTRGQEVELAVHLQQQQQQQHASQ